MKSVATLPRRDAMSAVGYRWSLLRLFRVVDGRLHLLLQIVQPLLGLVVRPGQAGELAVVLLQKLTVISQRGILIGLRSEVLSFLRRLLVLIEHLLVHLLGLLVLRFVVRFSHLRVAGLDRR